MVRIIRARLFVCVFDTGVNRAHALIEPALGAKDLHVINVNWGVDDPTEGHGTAMAGMIPAR